MQRLRPPDMSMELMCLQSQVKLLKIQQVFNWELLGQKLRSHKWSLRS